MGKKKKSKNVSNTTSINLMPVIILLVLYLIISFISKQSTININNRNNTVYENMMKNQEYAYMNDIKYKKEISKASGKYSITNLEFLMGPQELKEYIDKYDNNFAYYAYGKANPANGTYLKDKKIRADLNVHTTNTDGNFSVQEILDQAATYGDALASTYPNEQFILAFSDLNSVDYANDVINIITKNKEKYKNIKVVFGLEISTTLESNDVIQETSNVHLLALCVNPFDPNLLKEFPKKSLVSTYESVNHDFDEAVEFLNEQPYLIYGIAKPLQEFADVTDKQNYLITLFNYYKSKSPDYRFIEAYYDPYTYSKAPETIQMMKLADENQFHKVGSLSNYLEGLFE